MKSKLMGTMIAGVAAGVGGMAEPSSAAGNYTKCWGVNKCKAHTACGVGKSHIAATKKDFGDKFAKTATHDCAGMGKCAGKNGQLGWIKVDTEATCCKIDGSFLIVAGKDKKKSVKKCS